MNVRCYDNAEGVKEVSILWFGDLQILWLRYEELE